MPVVTEPVCQEIRRLYQRGLSFALISRQTGRARKTIARIVNTPPGEAVYTVTPPLGPALPTRTPLPMLRMGDLVTIISRHGRRRWWVGVSEDCTSCGARLFVEPPLDARPGAVVCFACGREAAEVRL